MVCGATLEYDSRPLQLTCSYCGKITSGSIFCPNGHFVCDDCHNEAAIHFTMDYCSRITSSSPIDIFEGICLFDSIPMLGCHHAFMAAGAFAAAIRNKDSQRLPEAAIHEIFHRTKNQAIGGYCGLTGVCGIAPALGACFSVLTGSVCGSDREQYLTMTVVSSIQKSVAELTGPSCCKAYARKSIEVAQRFLSEHLNIALDGPKEAIRCRFSSIHPHGCRKDKCPYYMAYL